ncbi:hypothetical protein [Thalassotalea fusca]
MDYFGSFATTSENALKLLTPVVDKALVAHQEGNYRDYAAIITNELAEKVTEESFARAHKEIAPQLGKLQSKSFLAALKRDTNPMLLYSAKYSGTEDDILINVTFKNGTHPPQIDWLWIE